MTRLPREGKNKTRLIPALGPKGAMEFHDLLARHTIGRASAFCISEKHRHLTISIEGGTPTQAAQWLGDTSIDCQEQPSGDLGQRIQTAAENAFAKGAKKVLIIGTDCPSIDESTLLEAEELLENNTLIYGPALDGGYYMIGMREIIPEVFQNISWGQEQVLNQSLAAAKKAGITPALLSPLSDVDHPEDLPKAEENLKKGRTLSVIIPTLNDEKTIAALLENISAHFPFEIILSDAGSSDSTAQIAQQNGATITHSEPGYTAQMNAGAKAATGELLLFLHPATLPPEDFPTIISEELQRPNTSAGTLQCSPIAAHSPPPHTAPAIFIRRSLFLKIGNLPHTPLTGNLELIKELQKTGTVRTVE